MYSMERITIAGVVDQLEIFQARFVKIDKFGWWGLEIISEDAGTKLTSTKLQDKYQTCRV